MGGISVLTPPAAHRKLPGGLNACPSGKHTCKIISASDVSAVQDEALTKEVGTMAQARGGVMQSVERYSTRRRFPHDLRARNLILPVTVHSSYTAAGNCQRKTLPEEAILVDPVNGLARQEYAWTLLYGWILRIDKSPLACRISAQRDRGRAIRSRKRFRALMDCSRTVSPRPATRALTLTAQALPMLPISPIARITKENPDRSQGEMGRESSGNGEFSVWRSWFRS
jgi:hypothetical protein